MGIACPPRRKQHTIAQMLVLYALVIRGFQLGRMMQTKIMFGVGRIGHITIWASHTKICRDGRHGLTRVVTRTAACTARLLETINRRLRSTNCSLLS